MARKLACSPSPQTIHPISFCPCSIHVFTAIRPQGQLRASAHLLKVSCQMPVRDLVRAWVTFPTSLHSQTTWPHQHPVRWLPEGSIALTDISPFR